MSYCIYQYSFHCYKGSSKTRPLVIDACVTRIDSALVTVKEAVSFKYTYDAGVAVL